MKILKIYKENNEFVIEQVDEFDHSSKRFFITGEALKEGLEAYIHILHQYQLEVSDDLWALVINHLNK